MLNKNKLTNKLLSTHIEQTKNCLLSRKKYPSCGTKVQISWGIPENSEPVHSYLI